MGAPSGLGGGIVMMPTDGRGKSSYTYCTGMSTVTADVTLNFDWSMTGARGGTNSTYGMCYVILTEGLSYPLLLPNCILNTPVSNFYTVLDLDLVESTHYLHD